MNDYPEHILLFSGKRKSGKDFLTDILKECLGTKCEILKISAPIKEHFAKLRNLDFNVLMSEKPNKEEVRMEMIQWSEDRRREDPGCFCRIACEKGRIAEIWIISDIRRKSDVKWFYEKFGSKIKTVRITADLDIRKERGFRFEKGIDDAESECDLDDYDNWDLEVINNDETTCTHAIKQVLDLVEKSET